MNDNKNKPVEPPADKNAGLSGAKSSGTSGSSGKIRNTKKNGRNIKNDGTNKTPGGNAGAPDNKTDWGREVRSALRTAGRVLLKSLSYILNILITLILVGVITGIIVGSAFALYVKNYIDPEIDPELLAMTKLNQTTKIYYMDYSDRQNRIGYPVEIESQRLFGSEDSIYVPFSQMPSYLISTVLAIEDHRFWDHGGVDWYRTAAAGLNFFGVAGDDRGKYGGSTITQQLIKVITEQDEYRIQRKVQEIFWALDLESKLSKSQIIEMYLNIVNLSQNCIGVQTAAYTYFGKDVSELNLLECATIAAIINSPTKYDPIRNPDNNKFRRNLIFKRMLELNWITQKEYDDNYDRDIVLNVKKTTDILPVYTWFTDMVIEDVINDLVEKKGMSRQYANILIYSGGLHIYTTMDPAVQAAMDNVYANDANFPANSGGIAAQSSMIVIDPYTGDILGVVGKRGEKTINRGNNLATQAVRPPGSAIKPVTVYAPALELGLINYGSVFDDVPVNFDRGSGWPNNLPIIYNGLTTINSAIERSVNTIAVRVLQKLTLEKSFSFAKNTLKMNSIIESKTLADGSRITDMGTSALGLGQLNYGVTLRELTAAYSIFINKGIFSESHSYVKVLDSDGKVILSNDYTGSIAISEQNAFIMSKMLEGVVSRGTATSITLRNTIQTMGKTGTTSNDYDRTFIGYTPYYLGGVWYGYEYPKYIGTQPSPALKIWDEVMKAIHQKYIDDAKNGGEPLRRLAEPTGIVHAEYCRDSGMLMTAACRADPRQNRAETGYFASGTEPRQPCNVHIMVKFDRVTGGVAHAGCPAEDIVEYGLIKVSSRNFPMQVTVTDAQYVYRDLPALVEPGSYWDVPFFVNTIPAGIFVGKTYKNNGRQFNSFCYEHFDFAAFRAGVS